MRVLAFALALLAASPALSAPMGFRIYHCAGATVDILVYDAMDTVRILPASDSYGTPHRSIRSFTCQYIATATAECQVVVRASGSDRLYRVNLNDVCLPSLSYSGTYLPAQGDCTCFQ